MLERHCLPLAFIERWGFGLGLSGEQGDEMMHANGAKIERRMKDKSANMRAVVEAHRLQNTPSLKSRVAPPIKKKKHQVAWYVLLDFHFFHFLFEPTILYSINKKESLISSKTFNPNSFKIALNDRILYD